MFNLEQSITEWRRQMLAAGLKTPTPLNELESHLREDIGRLKSTGRPEAEAFQLAVSRLGNPAPLRTEFNKLKKPASWPVTIGLSAYVSAMILMAVSSSWPLMVQSGALSAKRLLLYAHGVSLTAGYVAAFFAGCFGIFYLCHRLLHALTLARQQSLDRAACLFTKIAAGLTIIGVALGMIRSWQQLPGYLPGNLHEIASLCTAIWHIALLMMRRNGRLNEHTTMLMCIGGNVLVGLAWFGPIILLYGMPGCWPLVVFLGMNLLFLSVGATRASENVES